MNSLPIVDLISRHDGLLPLHATLAEAAALILRERGSSVIVVDDEGWAAGIVTEGDLLRVLRQRQDMRQPLADAMTAPVFSIAADTDFRQAYRMVTQQGLRHIVVTGADGRPLGVVSGTSIRERLGPEFFHHLCNVNTVMDRLFPRLPPDAPLAAALYAMEASRASCAVVVDGRRPLGILTMRDIVRLCLATGDNPPLVEVMRQPVITIDETRSLAAAAKTLAEHAIRQLVAVDAQGNATGLLSEHALLRPLELSLVDECLPIIHSRDAALLRTSHNAYYQRALLDNFPFPAWLKDTDSRFLAANRAFAELFGLGSPEEVIGKTDYDLAPPELVERYYRADIEVMTEHRASTVLEPQMYAPNIWHETYRAPVFDDSGQLLGTVGFARNVTQRLRIEESMRLRNRALTSVASGEPIADILELIAQSLEHELEGWRCVILLADANGRIRHCTAAPKLPESFPATLSGMAVSPGSPLVDLRQRLVVDDVAAADCPPLLSELAGQAGFAACIVNPLIGQEGKLLGYLFAGHGRPPRDDELSVLTQGSRLSTLIINHQRVTESLSDSQDTFRGIFDSVDEPLIVLGQDRRFIDASIRAKNLFAPPPGEMIGCHYKEFCAPGLNDDARIESLVTAAFAGQPQCFEYWVRSAAGHIFPGEVRLRLGNYFGEAVLIVSFIDISERKNDSLRLRIHRDLAIALASDAGRPAVLAAILQGGLLFREFSAGALYGRQGDGGFGLLTQAGLSPAYVAATREYGPDSEFAALAASGDLFHCQIGSGRCSQACPFDRKAIADEGLCYLAMLPIPIDGTVEACLVVADHHAMQISAATLDALDRLRRPFGRALERLAAQEKAQRQQENFSGLLDALNDFIFVVDLDGHILHHNQAVSKFLGYAPGTLIGQPIVSVSPPARQAEAAQIAADIVAGHCQNALVPLQATDGRQIIGDARIVSGYWNGQPVHIGISRDISEQLLAEERRKLAASVFEHAHEGIIIADPDGRIIEVNAAFSELTGYSRDEVIGQTTELLRSGRHKPSFYRQLWHEIRVAGHWSGEVWNRKKSGEAFVEYLTVSAVRGQQGEISHLVAIFSDITQIKEHQQRLEQLAHFDALTQLPNRTLLADRMQLAMMQCARSGKILAVCYLDLDGFKPVNDSYGHAAGDRLLIEVAQRLKECVRTGDTVSRLGGDEFVLLFSNLASDHKADHAVERVIAALARPFVVDGHPIQISASIGVTLYPQDGADSDTLLRQADQAMYSAKQAGRNRYHLFDPERDRRARIRHEEITRIREGLVNDEFVLYYQPRVNMRQGEVLGAEALIRWQHPEHGLLPPGDFLPVIEGDRLDSELGDWVLRQALAQLTAWVAQGLRLAVSVNISGEHLQQPDFVDRLGELLAAHPSVPPTLLELEILETAALEDIARITDVFAACHRLGVRFALDDFGTGYSSLTYFRRLPAEVLKIDQSFVRDMLDDPDDLAIVEGVIGLARAFRRQIVAEGVESVEHGLALLLLGCDEAQGYGIARPMPAEALPGWINTFQADELWLSASSFRWSHEDLPLLIAEVDHHRWKKTLYTWLDAPDASHPTPSPDERECGFGRWYYSPFSQRYAVSPRFAQLEPIHRRIHAIARQLFEGHAGLDVASRQRLRDELESASNDMGQCLQGLRTDVLVATQATKR
ncbi:MAG: EAL domain-containing protein [Azonexus sp.]|jgi:diguanylate cyclase (GGDEF)-like protein/PAS domain S-box-containing protein|uniref:EAL domain-containing protein n=1 Tax=Azonexus sp. TaxID=1872668 RepID=UPI002816A20F|nr:EAL domain-containing protein [Azonexus sp.]MDR0776356.1 EAL domain-containing protein [Azonexus sp.]